MNPNKWTKLAAALALASSIAACSVTDKPRQGTIEGEVGAVVATVREEGSDDGDAADEQNDSKPADGNSNSEANDFGPAPHVYFKDTESFSVSETQVEIIREGDGEVVPENATVKVKYHGVNGADASIFDSTYESNTTATFSLNRVIPGFRMAIAGKKVGSEILVAVAPQDGYGPSGGTSTIGADDTIIFVIEVLGVE